MERLLEYFTPKHYDINLYVDKHKGTARGLVSIDGKNSNHVIKFHAVDLTIDRVKINNEITKFSHQDGILSIDTTTQAQELRMDIDYHFSLNHNMQGAYLSSYTYNNREELIVSTQFESHYARECFPCIDEPAAKATFDLSITVPDQEDTVIANTEVIDARRNQDGSKTVVFSRTPRMSTYLLAFCIGKFKSHSKTSLHGVKVTTYCTLSQDDDSVDFANDIAVQSLDYYDRQFGIKYPLAKLDQIAIPDFEAGAMENWGLVTYRESCLLADKNTSMSSKQYIATVIAHELSHQWFGDLVTMEWWNNLWLNESFATVMEYFCVDAIHPEYNIWQDFFTGECLVALRRDALEGVQAVQQDVNDPAEISTLFDSAIVYAKGARLMLMLIRLMGQRQFFAGLKDYFKKHKYSNTTGDDLWAALQAHASFSVKELMDSWILQSGYPVYTDGTAQRFLLTGASDDTTWPMPDIRDDMSGHYLINLSGDEFTDALANFDKLSLEQQLRILIDRTLLAKTSLVSSASLLEILPKFKDNRESSIWDLLASIVADLKLFFPYDDADREQFQQYIYNMVAPQVQWLGYQPKDGESDNDSKLRQIVLGLLGYVESSEITVDLANLYQEDYSLIHPDIRIAVLRAKMRAGKEGIFDNLLKTYRTTSSPELRSDLLAVIASARQHTEQLLTLLEDKDTVRPQDHLYLFAYLLRNFHTYQGATEWFYGHWSYIEQLVGEKSIEDYPRILSSVIRTESDAERFKSFFAKLIHKPVLTRAIEVANTEIDARLRLIKMDNTAVHSRLREKMKNL